MQIWKISILAAYMVPKLQKIFLQTICKAIITMLKIQYCKLSFEEISKFSFTENFWSETKIRKFPHCDVCGKMKNLLSLKKISSNQLFSNFFSKTVTFTKFLQKICARESNVWKCDYNDSTKTISKVLQEKIVKLL